MQYEFCGSRLGSSWHSSACVWTVFSSCRKKILGFLLLNLKSELGGLYIYISNMRFIKTLNLYTGCIQKNNKEK
jgi:hypothetical protein